MKINTSRKAGFTLVEIMIVVAIIGLLAAIAIPNFIKARTSSQANVCIANMKQIEGAKASWALENKAAGGTAVTSTLYGTNGFIRVAPVCPSGSAAYALGTVDGKPVCPNVASCPTHVLP